MIRLTVLYMCLNCHTVLGINHVVNFFDCRCYGDVIGYMQCWASRTKGVCDANSSRHADRRLQNICKKSKSSSILLLIAIYMYNASLTYVGYLLIIMIIYLWLFWLFHFVFLLLICLLISLSSYIFFNFMKHMLCLLSINGVLVI